MEDVSGLITNDTIKNLNKELDDLKNKALTLQNKMDQQTGVIHQRGTQYDEKQKQVYGQSKEMTDKIKLLETREEMLKLAMNRNSYKKKVLYSLLSVILLLVIGLLCYYALMKKNDLVQRFR